MGGNPINLVRVNWALNRVELGQIEQPIQHLKTCRRWHRLVTQSPKWSGWWYHRQLMLLVVVPPLSSVVLSELDL